MKVIIGDKFSAFYQKTDNVSFTDFIRNPHRFRGTLMFTGLGLSRKELDALQKIAVNNNINLLYYNHPAPCHITHKSRPENCLISTPFKINENTYESQLILDDDAELVLDHLTGLHVQGMILIEACRQMFIAVAMDYFSHHDFAKERYGAINQMNCNFLSFVFPLPAKVRYRRQSAVKDEQRESITFCADVEVIQADRVVFSMEMKHTYYSSEKIASIENHKATSACQRLFKTAAI